MKTQLLVASICLAALAFSFEEASPAGKSKAKGKSVVPPSKGAPVLKGKDVVPQIKPVVNPAQTKLHMDTLKTSSPNWKTTPDQNAALGKLLGNQPLTDQDRQQLSDLLFNAQAAGLSKEDEVALGYLLLDQAASNNVASADPVSDVKNGPLFLKVFNNTGERLKVWVEIVPEMAEAKKAEPDKKEPMKKPLPLQYELAAGKAYDLQKDGKKLQATAVKVWAISPTRSWAQHRDEPLQLTMDMNMSKSYTLTFSDKE
jgi:hypothetical protein